MCYVCCKEFKGWCKSFTRTEVALSVLQALLLLVLIACISFLTLHLLVCSSELANVNLESPKTTKVPTTTVPFSYQTPSHSVTSPHTFTSSVARTTQSTVPAYSASRPPHTLAAHIECTWTPSKKTVAATHYYWTPQYFSTQNSTRIQNEETSARPTPEHGDDNEGDSEDDDAPQRYNDYVAALVKLKPPEEVTFGCILTKVSRHWTLTAASCIESIEEVDSLDSFFITESYGALRQGAGHAVADVQIHPLYQGANRSYDLAALRSDDALTPAARLPRLPTTLEHLLIAVGERFIILGYGGYRTVDKSPTGRRLRRVVTHTVSLAWCARAASAWAPRHLAGGGALSAGACGAAGECGGGALCGGPLSRRAAPCSYCAGTPLLRDGRLFGVMSDNRHCGVSCEPTLYVNVAAQRDWIDSVINT